MGADYFIFWFATRKRFSLLKSDADCGLFCRDIFVNAVGGFITEVNLAQMEAEVSMIRDFNDGLDLRGYGLHSTNSQNEV